MPLAEGSVERWRDPRRTRRRLVDLLANLRSGSEGTIDPTPGEASLHPLERDRLERLVPPPPRHALQAAFDALRSRAPHALIVRPDDGAWNGLLSDGGRYGPEVVAPPDDPPLGRDLPGDLRTRLLDDELPIHLPRLERWWVRHHDGLTALRTLLATLGARSGPWTADVAPWAWAWMERILPEARGLPSAWIPAPLGGADLQAWLGGDVAAARGVATRLRLRGSGHAPDLRTYRALAERALGEPGVARALWRACLHDGAEWTPPDDDERGHEDSDEDGDDAPPGTVWVRHPSQATLPGTRSLSHRDLLLLHAVALHGSARSDVLALASGFERDEVAGLLRLMVAHGLVLHGEDDRVRLAPLGLPAVRSRLGVEAFVGVHE
ncbi:MAG: hypothetical protein WD336_11670 [Trueperaceae bacterium]